MVEIKSGNTSVAQNVASPEQGLQNVQDRMLQMAGRDRRDRGDADGVDQVLSAVQAMLPQMQQMQQMPQLGLRAETDAAAAAEKMGTAGKTRLQAIEVDTQADGKASGESGAARKAARSSQAATLPLSGIKEGSLPANATLVIAATTVATAAVNAATTAENSGVAQSNSSALYSQQLMSDRASADGNAVDSAVSQSLETSRRGDENRKERGAFTGDEAQIKPASAESAQQRRTEGAARAAEPVMRSRADIAANTAANAAANAPAGATQDGWLYSFRSWEGQHAVRVSQMPGMHNASNASNASSSSFASLALHPTSALVEQRLTAHGDMTGRNDQWVLQEYGEEGRQDRQDGQQRQQWQEEDES